MRRYNIFLLILVCLATILLIACGKSPAAATSQASPTLRISPLPSPTLRPQKTRAEAIPSTAIKMTPEKDAIPPKLHSTLFKEPVPLGSGVNTAGAEDSAFITPDGNTIYFFFTPDPNIPAEKQLFDDVTGIWVSKKVGGEWQPAERVWLQDAGKLALDGCVFVQGNELWFGSAREGNFKSLDVWKAEFKNGTWCNWQNAGKTLNQEYQVGEFHITADGSEFYFHSSVSAGGKSKSEIWVSKKLIGEWQLPENVQAVNSSDDEGWPFVTQDGNELWFLRWYQGSPAVFMSKKINSQWSTPELVISQFAAEPSLDNAGNLYFTHHFIKDGKMIDADIYVAYRK